MQLTKYEHACFSVEKDEKILVIDPGEFSTDFLAPEHVVGVIITHEHPDHFDIETVSSIIDKNPEAIILAPDSITSLIESYETKTISSGESIQIGPFSLEFFGENHAIIHQSIDTVANTGVLINDILYYPGDSFVLPNRPVDTLALPVSAPWLKISEAMDFLTIVNPRFAFPTHDAILSTVGKEVTDRLIKIAADEHNIEYKRLTGNLSI